MPQPIFIVVEGLDGCGKSTLAAALAKKIDAVHVQTPLKAMYQVVRQVNWQVDERPGAIYPEMRIAMDAIVSVSPEARVLFYASLTLAAQVHIVQLLERGRSVVCDRWLMSTSAYGLVAGATNGANIIRQLAWQARRPNLTLFVDTPLVQRVERMQGRDGLLTPSDRWTMNPKISERLESTYAKLLCDTGFGQRAVRIDGSRTPDHTLEQATIEVEWSLI